MVQGELNAKCSILWPSDFGLLGTCTVWLHFSEKQLASVLTDFWIAGMETTATTLRWGIVLLVRNPQVQTKMQKEIDQIIGPNRQPKMADKTNMPYTSAVLMELQRKVEQFTMS